MRIIYQKTVIYILNGLSKHLYCIEKVMSAVYFSLLFGCF
jgi:hypothetical protein